MGELIFIKQCVEFTAIDYHWQLLIIRFKMQILHEQIMLLNDQYYCQWHNTTIKNINHIGRKSSRIVSLD